MSPSFSTSLCFFLYACTCIAASSSPIVPESSPTVSDDQLYSKLSFFTYYYTGGESLIGKLPRDTTFYTFVKKYARLQIHEHCKTNTTGVYKVRGNLFIQLPYWYGGGVYDVDRKTQGTVRFWLNGLWSEKSRQLLMAGSASWLVEGKPIILDAVLDLNYTVESDPTMYTGYISGTLKSMVSPNVPGYFDPFSIFSFPALPNYNYSLLPQAFGDTFSSDSDVPGRQWTSGPSHDEYKCCWVIMGESMLLEVEYAAECREDYQHCSPFGSIGVLPRHLLFAPIQCSASARKLRFRATFQNTGYDKEFGLNSTLIGEASWDDKKKELSGIACRLLDPLNRSANEVGDCTMRLSLRYTSFFSIRNDPKLVGRFRTTKHAEKPGYFRKISLTNADGNGLITHPDVKYEYTELDNVKRWCAAEKPVKKGYTYPDVHSDNMRLDMSVGNSRGEDIAWIYATPLWIGNDLYQKKSMPHSTNTPHLNISYMISLSSSEELKFGYLFESLNWSTTGYNEVQITAEGVYNAETGYLCMVGCRKLDSSTYSARDCEILVTLEFSPLNEYRGIKGTIASKRARADPLYFDDMIMHSLRLYIEKPSLSKWEMDSEIAMVLISNALTCVFVSLQILHVKKNPEVPSFISLFMLLILSVGYMIPLVLNLDVAHSRRYHHVEQSEFDHGGKLEAYDVSVRLSTLVAFLFQIRLLHQVCTAKQRDGNRKSLWIGEKTAAFVSISLYGVLLALLLNQTSNRNINQAQTGIAHRDNRGWGGLRPYAGVFLDGFLLPQVLLNAFRGSAVKAVTLPFYVGISALRLAPHAYNQYRAQSYPVTTYYYANPAIGFYSRAWDIMIPFGIVALAIVVFLQQRRGERRRAFFFKV